LLSGKKMKIIFLDIDGVITSARTGWFNIDIYAVNFLRWICDQSGARIVISSTWRYNHSLGFFRRIFGDVIFQEGDWKTPYLNSPDSRRGLEIKAWLEKHPQTQQYLILDDDPDFLPEQFPCLIRTDSHNGLLFDEMLKIRTYFNIETFPKELAELYQHPQMFAFSQDR
jgi:hypothetical protein